MQQPNDLLVPCKLIGIHGRAGVGKDTAAMYLHERWNNVWIESFADPLKTACAAMFGVSVDDFYVRNKKEELIEHWGVSPRMIAQFVGTDLVRHSMWKLLNDKETFGENFWVRRLAYKLQNLTADDVVYDPEDIVIVPDVRFQNEYEWIIQNKGIIIHLTRPGYTDNIGIPGHSSESGIEFTHLERTVCVDNSGTIKELEQKIDEIFQIFCERVFISPSLLSSS